jgi:hypothetical protein
VNVNNSLRTEFLGSAKLMLWTILRTDRCGLDIRQGLLRVQQACLLGLVAALLHGSAASLPVFLTLLLKPPVGLLL